MLKKNTTILWLVIFIFWIQSCSSPKYMYTPATHNLLRLNKKDDAVIAANIVTATSMLSTNSAESLGADVQGAYAISDNVGLRFNGYFKKETSQSPAQNSNGIPYEKLDYKKKGIELSAGIYSFSKNSSKFSFNIFGGIGFGKTSFIDVVDSSNFSKQYFYNNSIFNFFVQPSLTIKSKKKYAFTLASKIVAVNYSNVKTDYPNLQNEAFGSITSKPSFFIDLVFQHQFGFKNLDGIQFQIQHGFTTLLTEFSSSAPNGYKNQQYDYNNIWGAFGVVAEVNKLFNRSK